MLDGGLHQLYRDMLASQAIHYVRVEVWAAGKRLTVLDEMRSDQPKEDGLIVLPGSEITATLQSQVARNATLVVPEQLYPENDDDLLAPFGNELRCFGGILPADGSRKYIWQTFKGKIQDAVIDDQTGEVTVTASDRGQDVVDANFVNPENSIPGARRINEFQRLITAVVPDATFGASDTFNQVMPALTWEFNRGSALDEMFSSAGGLWYPLANGDFVARRLPWAIPGDPIITLSDGPNGVILATSRSRSRRDMFNSVTTTAERLNGDKPLARTAQDTNPDSPTYIGGKFGIKSSLMRRMSATTDGGVLAAAQARLRTGITPTHAITWTQIPDAAAELGDIVNVEITARGVTRVQVINSFTLPLDVKTAMSVTGRAQVIGAIEDGGFV
jgi:hypothetical protein